ncbi:MAG: methylated-DNA--[protein]-cysteine S-methyltransferase [Azonexus sp.]|nr:methylated-DNA--[protein]-cysteine S-methyltransferase [Azonexus sp.]MBP6203177.1 methylated-DNA--[protein]-cysteine S-methyltransferase [Azonexus sp.]
MKTRPNQTYQAIVAAPGFTLGVLCDEDEITGIDFLEPRPEIAASTPLAAEAVRQLRAYLADPSFAFGLPLKPAGTTFQRRVWEQISAIPNGLTHTYGDVAKNLKNAPRAVGQACGANPYPVVVPCHRVVATGGGLGGFARERGGFLLDVKRWLLAHENKQFGLDCTRQPG